jgi:ABC-type dipeptide/oligopeptide/nickel transport system permease subunit
MKITKLALTPCLAFAWIGTLIIVSLLAYFISPRNNVKQISFNPPSSGYNVMHLYNPDYDPSDNETIEIQSLKYLFLDKNNQILKSCTLWQPDHPIFVNENSIRKIKFLLPPDSLYKNSNATKRKIILHSKRKGFNSDRQRFLSLNHKKIITLSWNEPDDGYSITFNPVYLEGSPNCEPVIFGKSLLGRDADGKSLLALMIYGTSLVLKIILFSLIISLALALPVAFYRGYFDNWLANCLDALVNFVNSIPVYYLVVIIAVLYNYKLMPIIYAIAFVQWIEMEKIVYHQIKKTKKADFIKSARMIGKSHLAIIFTEIFPLCREPIIISTCFLAKRIVLIEASLSYLGYSVKLGDYGTWGYIISSAGKSITANHVKHIVIFPLLAIMLTLLAFNTLEKYFSKRKNYA